MYRPASIRPTVWREAPTRFASSCCESPNRGKILDELLGEQAAQLEGQIAEAKDQLAAVKELRAEIRLSGRVLTTTNEAMADRMEDRLALRRAHARMVCVGVLMDVLWIGTLILGVVTDVWWPFPLALAAVACLGFWLVADYNAHAAFLCPACGAEFRPRLGRFFVSGIRRRPANLPAFAAA